MKKLKKILVLLLTLSFCLCLFTGVTISVSAQEETTELTTEQGSEVQLPTTDEVIDSMTDGTHITEEDKQLIKDLVAKVESYTNESDSFFIKFIVPLIVAGVLCMIVGLILLLPYFRAKSETRTLKKMINTLKTQLDEYKKLVNVGQLEKDIEGFMTKEMEVFTSIIQEALISNGVEMTKIKNVLVAIKNGALNAWQASPEAIACLSSADAQLVVDALKENAKLKAYVKKTSGEKAVDEALM